MSVRGPNNVRRAVQTDPTLLRYSSAMAEKFDRFQTSRNNTQQHPTTCNRVCKRTQHVTSNNVGSCWPTMLPPFARGLKAIFTLYRIAFRVDMKSDPIQYEHLPICYAPLQRSTQHNFAPLQKSRRGPRSYTV